MPYLQLAPRHREYNKQSLVRHHSTSLSDVRKTTDKVRTLPMLMASRPMLWGRSRRKYHYICLRVMAQAVPVSLLGFTLIALAFAVMAAFVLSLSLHQGTQTECIWNTGYSILEVSTIYGSFYFLPYYIGQKPDVFYPSPKIFFIFSLTALTDFHICFTEQFSIFAISVSE